jgi:hypothetical protein
VRPCQDRKKEKEGGGKKEGRKEGRKDRIRYNIWYTKNF